MLFFSVEHIRRYLVDCLSCPFPYNKTGWQFWLHKCGRKKKFRSYNTILWCIFESERQNLSHYLLQISTLNLQKTWNRANKMCGLLILLWSLTAPIHFHCFEKIHWSKKAIALMKTKSIKHHFLFFKEIWPKLKSKY